jgi:flagellar motor switch protein FliG
MRLENEAAELAEEIRHQMFVLDDLMLLDDRAIQRVLRDLSDEDLAMALKNASEETRALFFGNMSARAADMLRENMDVASERPEDIEAAQQRIINTVRLLEERAEIVISNSRKWR